MNNHNILVVIPARGGSKGIPRKNIRPLNGKPLIYYSIQNAKRINAKKVDVYISSDDDEILMLAKKFGANGLKRDKSKAKDQTTLDPVIYDAFVKASSLENTKYDIVITLQPTSPLLSSTSINRAIEQLVEGQLDTVISGTFDSHLTWLKEEGEFRPNYKERVNRQELPEIYKETGGFVITEAKFVQENSRFGEKIQIYPLSKKEAIDIDDFEDWNLCEYNLKRKKILFVVSGNSTIGLGHVYNTLSVANEILNHQITFLVDKDSGLAFEKIAESNYKVILQDRPVIEEDILSLAPDVIINDRLDTSNEEMQVLQDNGIKTINFEDIGPGAQRANLVINAMYPEGKLILNHYFGAKYFILRDEFVFTPKIEIKEKINTILIAFGGVDPNNFTKRILNLITPLQKDNSFSIHVVTGLGYKNYSELKNKFPHINLMQNVQSISEQMQLADIVFTSAGRTTFEVASIGVPAIVLCQNQRETTHFFASEKNGFYNLGLGEEVSNETILEAFYRVSDFNTRKVMHERMLSNGLKNGKKRVLELINNVIEA